MKSRPWKYCLLLTLGLFASNGVTDNHAPNKAYSYKIIKEYPHDPALFTQGLAFHQGKLYESAGQYHQSSLTVRSLESLQAEQRINIAKHFFAEGLTIFNQQLYQLTWKAGLAWVYAIDPANQNRLKQVVTHQYQGVGWGLCNNGQQLIMSNGSSTLQFIDPISFNTTSTLEVTENGLAISQLNELEWVEGKIYANIWHTDRIIIINPLNGEVEASVDLKGLLPKPLRTHKTNVLNGIAYDTKEKRLFVTGKYWPRLYHIAIHPLNSPD